MAKQLAREGKLIDHLYTPEVAEKVRAFASTIKVTGGYSNVEFPLKNGKNGLWTNLYNASS